MFIHVCVCVCVCVYAVLCLVAQSCLTLCDPMDCSSPGSSVHGDSQGFSTQEYWSGLPCPSPGDLPHPGIEPGSLRPLTHQGSLTPIESERKVKVKSLSHVRLFVDPMDCSPPGSSRRGILQARVLEWVAISFSRGPSGPRDQTGSLNSRQTL